MCLDIFRDPGKAFSSAAKGKSMAKTGQVLVLDALIVAASLTILTWNAVMAPWIFALVIGIGIVGGYVLSIISGALGTKGGFFEGFTSIAYALAPMAVGILLIALFAHLPGVGTIIGYIAVMIMFSLGLSVLYRGVKDLYRSDMITAFVAVFIFGVSFVIAVQLSLSLGTLTSLGGLIAG